MAEKRYLPFKERYAATSNLQEFNSGMCAWIIPLCATLTRCVQKMTELCSRKTTYVHLYRNMTLPPLKKTRFDTKGIKLFFFVKKEILFCLFSIYMARLSLKRTEFVLLFATFAFH